jgi:hypothetical protein
MTSNDPMVVDDSDVDDAGLGFKFQFFKDDANTFLFIAALSHDKALSLA